MGDMPSLPWVGWYDTNRKSHLSSWMGNTRDVVLVARPHCCPLGCPHDPLPPDAQVFELPAGADPHAAAQQAGGIVVIVFDVPEPLGPVWQSGEGRST